MTSKTAKTIDLRQRPDDPAKLESIVRELVEIISDLDSATASSTGPRRALGGIEALRELEQDV